MSPLPGNRRAGTYPMDEKQQDQVHCQNELRDLPTGRVGYTCATRTSSFSDGNPAGNTEYLNFGGYSDDEPGASFDLKINVTSANHQLRLTSTTNSSQAVLSETMLFPSYECQAGRFGVSACHEKLARFLTTRWDKGTRLTSAFLFRIVFLRQVRWRAEKATSDTTYCQFAG